MKIAISSGHGKYVRGASGYIDEVDEARKVVNRLGELLAPDAVTFHDDTSHSQDENLYTIVAWHNDQVRDLDISVHFNAYQPTEKPMGTECLYVTQSALASKVANAISGSGHFTNRGAKHRSDLYFLNNTAMPAILIEVCFVDSKQDATLYEEYFEEICQSLAQLVPKPVGKPSYEAGRWLGTCSWFGGPDDTGVSPDEGLAFIYEVEEAPNLFLNYQPAGTSGLARRLDPSTHYIAMRWDYDIYPKEMLASGEYKALVKSPKTGKELEAYPADWGPHSQTERVADLSPGLMEALGIETDDNVEVIFPV